MNANEHYEFPKNPGQLPVLYTDSFLPFRGNENLRHFLEGTLKNKHKLGY